MVVIGNPPYNVGQENENDNNKNRRYDVIDARVRETYAKDSRATNKNALSDAYVKFFRWAVDRLQGRDGIVCFVSNNSFVDQIAFDGMRRHLLQDFTAIYHLDLHGNVRQNPKLSGTTHNVFGIQVGVGVTIAIRRASSQQRGLYYYRVPEDWRRTEKVAFLAQKGHVAGIEWQHLAPDERHNWLTEGMRPEFALFLPIGSREAKDESGQDAPALFKNYGRGLQTTRDYWVYGFDRNKLVPRIRQFIETYNGEVDRWRRRTDKTTSVDDFVLYDDHRIKWSRDLKLDLQRGNYAEFTPAKVRASLYRPFCRQWLFFDRIMNEEVYQQPRIFPTPTSEAENVAICVSTIGHRAPFTVLASSLIPNLTINAVDGFQCFPYYTYDEDGSNRRENITDWALARFQAAYGVEVAKRDIFHYVYGLLSHPAYRERYAANLRRELPRIPLLAGAAAFRRCAEIGARLMALHLGYESHPPYPLRWEEHRDSDGRVSFTVKKMRLNAERDAVIVNETLTLAGVPADTFVYRLGNRSALEWVIDQYQVSEDNRSGIVSDPNRADDPQYIANLVCRVVAVSVETVALTRALAAEVALPEALPEALA